MGVLNRTTEELNQDLLGLDKLLDGTAYKTVNGNSILGEGDITIEGGGSSGSSIPVSGVLNLTSSSTALTLSTIYLALANNTLRFYVVGDSTGTIPSSESYVTVNSAVKTLIGAGGASVGDILIVGKLSSKPVYKLLPLNDAKPANGNFPGADGLETVWDKTQINKIAGIEATANANNSATRDGSNMDNCLQTGFYPWCTLGRPTGATGAFSLVVRRSTTPDFNGNYTVEQTCFGREAELGQIYTRLIFDKGDGSAAEYMEWMAIDKPNILQSTGSSTTAVMSQDAVTKAIKSNGVFYKKLGVFNTTGSNPTNKEDIKLYLEEALLPQNGMNEFYNSTWNMAIITTIFSDSEVLITLKRKFGYQNTDYYFEVVQGFDRYVGLLRAGDSASVSYIYKVVLE